MYLYKQLFLQFLDSFEESKKQEIERCNEIQQKIEELASQIGESLESVGTENLPSRSDFVSMKEDLAFRFLLNLMFFIFQKSFLFFTKMEEMFLKFLTHQNFLQTLH